MALVQHRCSPSASHISMRMFRKKCRQYIWVGANFIYIQILSFFQSTNVNFNLTKTACALMKTCVGFLCVFAYVLDFNFLSFINMFY